MYYDGCHCLTERVYCAGRSQIPFWGAPRSITLVHQQLSNAHCWRYLNLPSVDAIVR